METLRSAPTPPESPQKEAPPAIDGVFILAALLVLFAGLFGGASRENPLRLAAVELMALPVAALAVRRLVRGDAEAKGWIANVALAILALTILTPLAQLIPLPPDLWPTFPGQGPRLEALRLAGIAPGWLPLSLAPHVTDGSAVALIPPAAMFLVGLTLNASQGRRLAALWVALAVAGLALGILQAVEPGGGPAYLYRTTNSDSVVGLFANRNHEAGYLLATLPIAAALAMSQRRRRRETENAGVDPAPWLVGAYILTAVVALGVIRSRAGIVLAAPAVLAAVAVLLRSGRRSGGWIRALGIGAGAVLAAGTVALFALTPILDRFGTHSPPEFRYEAWPYVAHAALGYLPLGSGIGSFERIYESVEPLSLVSTTYFNHAHNDFLELWLETGLVGAAIFGLFALWLAYATWRAWREGSHLARAASACVLLLLAESWVDYPLRTETGAVLLAWSCAVLATQGKARR